MGCRLPGSVRAFYSRGEQGVTRAITSEKHRRESRILDLSYSRQVWTTRNTGTRSLVNRARAGDGPWGETFTALRRRPDTSPIFIRNFARVSFNTTRMPNCGHPSLRDVTLTTQVVLLVDRMCGGAKLAACANDHGTIDQRATHPINHESQNPRCRSPVGKADPRRGGLLAAEASSPS